jgi:hypothetical protein
MAFTPAVSAAATPRPIHARASTRGTNPRDAPKQHGAAGRDNQQCALDPPRAVAIQQYADRDLSRREGQEIDRREETKIRCTERQIGRELVGDQRVDGSEQICQVKSDGERQQHANNWPPLPRQIPAWPPRLLS